MLKTCPAWLEVTRDGFRVKEEAAAVVRRIFALAADRKLPVLYDFPIPPTAFERGLVSYAVDIRTLFRHVAEQVDRILQGDKPGDIPVARPWRFRLIIDHGAARALGLRVPRALLLRDRLLEHVEDVSALRARAHSPRD